MQPIINNVNSTELIILSDVLGRLPTSGKYGKMISIIALHIIGYYYISANPHRLSDFEHRVLNSIMFYRDGNDIKYALFGYNGSLLSSKDIIINIKDSDPIVINKDSYGDEEIQKICNALGFNNPRDYIGFSYSLNSIIAILDILPYEVKQREGLL